MTSLMHRSMPLSSVRIAADQFHPIDSRNGFEDEAELPSFRFPMEDQQGRVSAGGSAKEATVKQFPVSKGLSGVSMRLNPGGLRELHWHANSAEWGYVIKGSVRATAIAPGGISDTNQFNPGDIWYFPRGHGHAIQCLGPEECHFIMVFDNGSFADFDAFSSTDWLGHLPHEVLTQSLGLPASALSRFPREEQYIIQGRIPEPRFETNHDLLESPSLRHRYPLLAQRSWQKFPGGIERRASVKEFPISTTITGVIADLEPGAIREPHWHPHANEWQYYIGGQARMTVYGSAGRARTETFGAGDVGYVPQGFGHYIQNIGDKPCRILIAYDSGEYQEVSLSTWLASAPRQLVADNFQTSDSVVEKLPDQRIFMAAKNG